MNPIAYKYLGVLTRQFRDYPHDNLTLVAIRFGTKNEVKEKWYHPRDELSPLLSWASDLNNNGFNIYCCWAGFKQRARTIDALHISTAFVADWDGETPKELETTPTIKVQTSPGRWQHVYVHEPMTDPGPRYKELAREVVGVDTGPSGDPVHLWRVPGLMNYPRASKKRDPCVSTWDGRVNGRANFNVPMPTWVETLLSSDVPQGARSEEFHKVVGTLARQGWSAERIAIKMRGTWAEDKFGKRLLPEVIRSFDKVDKRSHLISYDPKDEEKSIEWLWRPYLPLREVTLLDGDGGVGKTAMMLRIAKELMEGGVMPNGQKLPGGNNVLFVSTESNYDTVSLPLLKRMGLKSRRFFHLEKPKFTLDDEGMNDLRHIVRENKIRLVILDPIAQFLPLEREMNRYQDAIYTMSMLQSIAKELNCGIVAIRHNGKGQKDQLGHRGGGVSRVAIVLS